MKEKATKACILRKIIAGRGVFFAAGFLITRKIRTFNNYSAIFTEPEENNCFSIITRVIIRAAAFSFLLFVSSSITSRIRAVAILKLLLQYYNHLAWGDYRKI